MSVQGEFRRHRRPRAFSDAPHGLFDSFWTINSAGFEASYRSERVLTRRLIERARQVTASTVWREFVRLAREARRDVARAGMPGSEQWGRFATTPASRKSRDCDRSEADRDHVRSRLYRHNHQERLQLARDLHDYAGQQTMCLKLGLNALRSQVSTPEAASDIERLLSQVNALGQELHRVALQLRPTALDDLGLTLALSTMVDDWGGANGVTTFFRTVGDVPRMAPEIEITLFRVTQEALTNISKHAAGVTTASVLLRFEEPRICLTVEDDGRGFPTPTDLFHSLVESEKLGILGMRERVTLLNGEFKIQSAPGQGTTIFVRVDLARGRP